MPVTEETYQRVALEDTEGSWELHRGQLRSKPSGTARHNRLTCHLGFRLIDHLDRDEYCVRINCGRVRCSSERYRITCYVPDVFVFPIHLTQQWQENPHALEVYADPLPLVVEVWDPPLGDYDTDAKLPAYREHGDQEIWRLHPFECMLTVWRRQPDGSYAEPVHRGGTVEPTALPGVTIDLDALFV